MFVSQSEGTECNDADCQACQGNDTQTKCGHCDYSKGCSSNRNDAKGNISDGYHTFGN